MTYLDENTSGKRGCHGGYFFTDSYEPTLRI